MNWFEQIKLFYSLGLWSPEMVRKAVIYKKISEDECSLILAEA